MTSRRRDQVLDGCTLDTTMRGVDAFAGRSPSASALALDVMGRAGEAFLPSRATPPPPRSIYGASRWPDAWTREAQPPVRATPPPARAARVEDIVARLSAPDRRATRAAAALALVLSGLEWPEVAALRVGAFLPRTSPPSVIVVAQGDTKRGAGWYAPIGEQLVASVAAWWQLTPARGAAFGELAGDGVKLRDDVLAASRDRGLAADVATIERASRIARRMWRRRAGGAVVHEGTVPAQTTAPAAAAAERALYRTAIAALEPTIARQAEKVAALEAADRELRAHLASSDPGRCGAWNSARPCDGELDARWCTTCGKIVLRCRKHGGGAAAAVELAERHASPLRHLVAGVDVAALPALRAEARRIMEAS